MWLIGAVFTITAAYLSVTIVAPVTLGIGGAVAVGVAIVEYTTASAFVFHGPAPIGHLRIEPRTTPGRSGRPPEPAYRSYYLGPVFRDYGLALRTAARRGWEGCFGGRPADLAAGRPRPQKALAQRLIDGWTHIGIYVPLSPVVAKTVTFGPMVGGLIGLVAGAVAAAAVLTVISTVFGLLTRQGDGASITLSSAAVTPARGEGCNAGTSERNRETRRVKSGHRLENLALRRRAARRSCGHGNTGWSSWDVSVDSTLARAHQHAAGARVRFADLCRARSLIHKTGSME